MERDREMRFRSHENGKSWGEIKWILHYTAIYDGKSWMFSGNVFRETDNGTQNESIWKLV